MAERCPPSGWGTRIAPPRPHGRRRPKLRMPDHPRDAAAGGENGAASATRRTSVPPAVSTRAASTSITASASASTGDVDAPPPPWRDANDGDSGTSRASVSMMGSGRGRAVRRRGTAGEVNAADRHAAAAAGSAVEEGGCALRDDRRRRAAAAGRRARVRRAADAADGDGVTSTVGPAVKPTDDGPPARAVGPAPRGRTAPSSNASAMDGERVWASSNAAASAASAQNSYEPVASAAESPPGAAPRGMRTGRRTRDAATTASSARTAVDASGSRPPSGSELSTAVAPAGGTYASGRDSVRRRTVCTAVTVAAAAASVTADDSSTPLVAARAATTPTTAAVVTADGSGRDDDAPAAARAARRA